MAFEEKNIYVYDARDVVITIDGVYITGFAPESKVVIEKEEDNTDHEVGVDGIVHYGVNADGTATCTMHLMSTSPYLKMLREYSKERKIFTLNITDMNDNAESYAFNDCVIKKTMKDEKGQTPHEVEVPIFVPYFEDLRNK